MYKCKYCGNKITHGTRNMVCCDLFPPKEKGGEVVPRKSGELSVFVDIWVCGKCRKSSDNLDNLAEWSDEE